jgi:branched-chain amino acid aminotransferase
MSDPGEAIVYLNGEFVPEREAKVAVWDRGFSGGDGVYEVTRTFGHRTFKLDAHIARLYRSLKYVRIDCGLSPADLETLSREILRRNLHLLKPVDDVAIWQVISRGRLQSTLSHKASSKPTVAIYCLPVAFEGFARQYVEGCLLMTPSTRRTPPQSLDPQAKITNKMNHMMAAFEAQQVDPRCVPLMLDIEGNIAETHLGNFFFVKNGTLCTSTEKTVLGGITRSSLIAMAREMRIPVVEGNFTPFDVYNADEAFTTSTSPTITPVRSLNGVAVGAVVPGPLTLGFIRKWNAMVGIDIVEQAMSHLEGNEVPALIGKWRAIREDNPRPGDVAKPKAFS